LILIPFLFCFQADIFSGRLGIPRQCATSSPQDRYEERLEQAYRLLKAKPPVNENTKEAPSFLSIKPALVPAVDHADDDNNNSSQHSPHQVPEVAKYICDKLLNSTAKHNFNLVLQEDDTSPIKIHHSCIIVLRPISHALQLSI
jgi:hypothetical protein